MSTEKQQNSISWQDLKKVVIADFTSPVLAVCLVNGEAVRGSIDPDYSLVCDSINCSWMKDYLSVAPYEIWVGDNVSLVELDKLLLRNVTKTLLMMEGMDATPAHDMAIIAEQHARANPDKALGMLLNALGKLNDKLAGLLMERAESEGPEMVARNPSKQDAIIISWDGLHKGLLIDTINDQSLSITAPSSIKLDDAAPKQSKIQVMRTGTFFHRIYGKFTITAKTLKNMLDNFIHHHPKSPTEMVVDYEHMSSSEPAVIAPAAGWVKGLEIQDNKLYAMVEWTPEALNKINIKEYQFISPEFTLKYKDKENNQEIGPTLLSVALTNRPFLEGMEPVALNEIPEGAVMLSEGLNKPVQARDLAEITAAEAMQLVGVDTIKVDNIKKEHVMEISDKDYADLKAKADKVSELEGKLTLTEKRATDAEGVIALRDCEAVVNAAITAHKLLPAQKDEAVKMALRDKAGFEAFIAGAPVIGPAEGEAKPGQFKQPGNENKETQTMQLTEAEEKVGRIVAKSLNMDPDKYLLKLREAKQQTLK